MLLRSLIAAGLLLSGLITVPKADACQPPLEGWQGYVEDVHRENVPHQGLLIFPIQLYFESSNISHEVALNYVSVTVRDEQNREVPGSLSWSSRINAVTWSPDMALGLGTFHSVNYRVDNEALISEHGQYGYYGSEIAGSFTFRTRETLAEPLFPPAVSSAVLTEARRTGAEACCDLPEEDCFNCGPYLGGCQSCWATSYRYLPKLEVTWGLEVFPETDYLIHRVDLLEERGSWQTLSTYGLGFENELNFSHAVEEPKEEYCLRLVTTRISDNAEVSTQTVCLAQADLIPIQRNEPPRPDTSRCLNPPTDPDPDPDPDPLDPENPNNPPGLLATDEPSCGCNATHAERPSAFALFILLGLVGLRRSTRTS